MFGWDDAFLLSMTAAGAIIPTLQTQSNLNMIRMGRQLEQSAFETNLAAIRAQSADESLNAMQQLRENVSSQIVINAARGVSSGAGSAHASIAKSEGEFAKDESTRRMNLLAKENELRANNVLSGLHTLTSETQLGQSLTHQIFNNLPISSLVNRFKSNKSNNNYSSKASSIAGGIGKKAGFGLDQV